MAQARGEGLIGKSGAVRPTVSVYQNGNFISELLQQMVTAGLIASSETESDSQSSKQSDTEGTAGLKATAGLTVPTVGSVGVDANLGGTRGRGKTDSSRRLTRQQYVYSQAYYLHTIRGLLKESNLVKNLTCRADAETLIGGEFVEYKARFRVNEINAILDIATPEMVSSIVEYSERAKVHRYWDADDLTIEQKRSAVEKGVTKALDRARLAGEVTRAIRADFRSDATCEYYGTVMGKSDLTVVSIMESAHFLIEDKDRILDGEFSVLGKVASGLEENASLFQRNKLLYRLNVDYIDGLFRQMEELASTAVDKRDPANRVDKPELFDVGLSARLEGASIKVLPVAVFV